MLCGVQITLTEATKTAIFDNELTLHSVLVVDDAGAPGVDAQVAAFEQAAGDSVGKALSVVVHANDQKDLVKFLAGAPVDELKLPVHLVMNAATQKPTQHDLSWPADGDDRIWIIAVKSFVEHQIATAAKEK